ncbi:MAG: ferritin-like domain-containing protein [Acidimicrobiales bacterium]
MVPAADDAAVGAVGTGPESMEALAQTIPADEKDDLVHAVTSAGATCFTWDYERSRPALAKLYESAKTTQWNVSRDIDWSVAVDPWKLAGDLSNPLNGLRHGYRNEPPFDKLSDAEWLELGVAQQGWVISQFLHGEQGALICTAKIVQSVPWVDAKVYAATQVMDEARHVEVYSRYLKDKMAHAFPINVHLRSLLDDVVSDSRWDMTYLGMQIMIEGLALAAFGFQYQMTSDPLLKQITRYVMADEARHMAFGVLSLREAYAQLSGPEIRERQEFCYEAAIRMRDRFLSQEVWEWAGLPVRQCCEVMLNSEVERQFRTMLFSKIVPNLKNLGLLDAGDGWLRERFGDLGVLRFEHAEDAPVAG